MFFILKIFVSLACIGCIISISIKILTTYYEYSLYATLILHKGLTKLS